MHKATLARTKSPSSPVLQGTAEGQSLAILSMLLAVGPASGDQDPWHYAVGEQRSAQQANFCLREELALELARTFEQQGARAGYAALDRATDCTVRVQSFTPLKVIKRVPIATRDGGQYTVKIVEIQTASGAREYLITTREVHE